MKVSDKTSVSMPIKNMIGIIVAVAMGVFAYTEVTARLTSLETSRQLFNADLLKKSEQLPTDQEQFMLLEDLYKTVEKIEIFFEYFSNLPKWFTNLWILVVASVFGIKGTQIFRNGKK